MPDRVGDTGRRAVIFFVHRLNGQPKKKENIMGNRCTITFEDDNQQQHPVMLYLHWNGGLESVLAFVSYTWDTFERGRGDVYTFQARFCQVVGNYFPNGLSLYGHSLAEANPWITDNGHWHFRIGKDGFELLNRSDEMPAAMAHNYWTGSPSIFDWIKDAMTGEGYRPTKGGAA